jgi:hypothetical protein
MHTKEEKDNLSRFWFMASNAVPPIGFFLYFKHRNHSPNKAKRALQSALIGIPVAIAAGYLMSNYVLK